MGIGRLLGLTKNHDDAVQLPFPDGELERAAELGAIDDRSARVWVRWPGAVRLKATLTVEGQALVTAFAELTAETDWTGAIDLALPDPAPGARFTVSLGDRHVTGRLAPAPGAHSGITFGFGSCHMPFARRDDYITLHDGAAIYPAMLGDLQQAGAERLLLLGDQIYADHLDGISVEDILDADTCNTLSHDILLAEYRRLYRGFFNQEGFRRLREAFPTACIWDDHEILDNWGSEGRDSPRDLMAFDAASRAYCEYQHLRHPGGEISDPPYPYWFCYGDVGFIVLDTRGVRDYGRERIIGDRQWEWLNDLLASDTVNQMQTLFIVSTVPVAHASRWFTRIWETSWMPQSKSIRDRWSSTGFIASRDELLDLLFDWQTSGPRRQVYLLSGDVHSASAFTIRRRHQPGVIRQVTSSAMATPPVLTQIVFNFVAVRAPDLMEPRFQFARHFLSITNNFGVASVEPLADGGHRVDISIRSWDPDHRQLWTSGRVVTVPGQ